MLDESTLREMYTCNTMSSAEIATDLGCSVSKVNYWLAKYRIPKRSIGDAVYARHNPGGDPFQVMTVDTLEKAELYGMGIGLYWGEGTKANIHSVRLGNTDATLLRMFMRFLIELYGVDKADMKFGLQIFTDIDQQEALTYWCKALGVNRGQFYKVHVTRSGSIGTYRHKSNYGVVTMYYHNTRLRDILVSALPR